MSMMSVIWRRLDVPGHDACRLVRQRSGWRLEGVAAFRHESGAPACVSYAVDCDGGWRTRAGAVTGWVGGHALDLRVRRTASGTWLLGDQAIAALDECLDLDLGFTPATNLFQLRRMALAVGQAADVPVAWLDVPDGGLRVLHQRYERLSVEAYRYETPLFDYVASLHVGDVGFVTSYPGLWEAEAIDAQQDVSTGTTKPRR